MFYFYLQDKLNLVNLMCFYKIYINLLELEIDVSDQDFKRTRTKPFFKEIYQKFFY
jgi:hypothetical protein